MVNSPSPFILKYTGQVQFIALDNGSISERYIDVCICIEHITYVKAVDDEIMGRGGRRTRMCTCRHNKSR
jgi:hypothetical protein